MSSDPHSPTEALVWPPLVSQGFGGDAEAIYTDDGRHSPRHEGAQREKVVFEIVGDGLAAVTFESKGICGAGSADFWRRTVPSVKGTKMRPRRTCRRYYTEYH